MQGTVEVERFDILRMPPCVLLPMATNVELRGAGMIAAASTPSELSSPAHMQYAEHAED